MTTGNNHKFITSIYILLSFILLFSCKEKSGKDVKTSDAPAGNGIIIMSIGDVKTRKPGKEPVPAKMQDIVNEGDIIETGKNSNLVAQFNDNIIIRIESESTLSVQSIQIGKKFEVSLEQGLVLSKIKKLVKDENYSIRTPTAVAAIRGTEFSTSYNLKESVIAVHEGKVAVKPIKKDAVIDEKIYKETKNEIIVESNKVAVAKEVAVKDGKEEKIEISVKPISKKESLVIEKVSIISFIEKPEKLDEKELTIITKEIQKKDEKITNTLKIEEKTERINILIQKKPQTLVEIKEVFERIDEITLFNGRVINGAIISRGNVMSVLTIGGVISVKQDEIKGIRVLK